MALTNTQYNSIMRLYEQRQTKNRHLRDERLHYVYNHVTGYRNLDESVATLSVAQGKKMLNGDLNALSELKERLHKLTSDKRKLLCDAGLPFDYLDPIFDCPDCQDTGYVNGIKCHCFRQAEIELLYQQSNLKEVLEKENFNTLSFDFFQGEDLATFQTAVKRCQDFAHTFFLTPFPAMPLILRTRKPWTTYIMIYIIVTFWSSTTSGQSSILHTMCPVFLRV